MLTIKAFACYDDNFGYLVHDPDTGATAAIDAPETGPVLAALEATGWLLTDIFITHHHTDHIGALPALIDRFSPRVFASTTEGRRIHGVTDYAEDGDRLEIGTKDIAVIATPGHTAGHLCYYAAEEQALFSGDTLFSLGCGRLFEGTADQMYDSLSTLARLPDDTSVFCGHEYTVANARFALTVDPDNPALKARAADARALVAAGKPTIPARLGDEKAANPFLRAADPGIAERLGMAGADPRAVFAALRTAKDSF